MKDLSLYELYDYQKEGVKFALDNPYCLIADKMGLGKTRQSLAVADSLKLNTLIVVPASLIGSWKNEIKQFCPRLNYEIISYSSIGKVRDRSFQIVIADECHYLKNRLAIRTKKFNELVLAVAPERLILLSGTPIKNKIPELYTTLYFTALKDPTNDFNKVYPSYYAFCNHFSNAVVKKIKGITIYDYEGAKNVEELSTRLKRVMIRRLPENVLSLPNTVNIQVPFKGMNIPEYKKVVEDYSRAKEVTPEFITVKRLMSESKCKFTVGYTQLLLEELDQVIIFSDHKNTVKLISEALNKSNVPSSYISSDVDLVSRETNIDKFKNKKIKVLCATIGVGSVGLNLQQCNTIIFNDFPFIPADLHQAQKRIHRIGQQKTCFYHYIISNKIDEKILNIIQRKIDIIEEVYK